MKNNLNFFLKYFFFLLFVVFVSFFLYKGVLGSDGLEVYNFVHGYINGNYTWNDYLLIYKNNSQNLKISFFNKDQVPSYLTFHHRFLWFLQTLIIAKVVSFFQLFPEYNNFIMQYLSGYILTLYTVLSFILIIFYCKKNFVNNNSSVVCASFIFFGTGLISFFTGSYIESLILLLFILKFFFEKKKNYLIDFLIILIKPYYYIIIFFYYLANLNFKNIFSKKNFSIFVYLFVLLLLYLAFRIFLVDSNSNINYISGFSINLDIKIILKNLFAIYFSPGIGLIFCSTAILILIIIGHDKQKTVIKFAGIFALTIFLSFFNDLYGFHGQAPGGRYVLPSFLIFLPEYIRAIKIIQSKIFEKKFYIIFLIMAFLAIFNIPTLEYRNTSLPEYNNDTVFKSKPVGPIINYNNKTELFKFPIFDFKFNNLIFSNTVLIHKIFKIEKFSISNFSFNTKSIYPMTGMKRLLFIKDNNLKNYSLEVYNFVNKNYFFLFTLYYFSFFFLLFFFIKLYLNFYYKNKK